MSSSDPSGEKSFYWSTWWDASVVLQKQLFHRRNLLRLSSCLQSSLRYKSSSWFTSLCAGAELVNAKNSSSVSSGDCRSGGSPVTRFDVILFISCLSRFLAISLVWSSPHHRSRNWGKVTAASISSLSRKHPPNRTSIPFRTALAKNTANLAVECGRSHAVCWLGKAFMCSAASLGNTADATGSNGTGNKKCVTVTTRKVISYCN